MQILTVIVGCFLAIFSSTVVTYIAMATPVGPWIAPTLALLASVIFKLVNHKAANYSKNIVLATAMGSVGGIMAVACSFSYPTLYFLDKNLFNSWLASPVYFIGVLVGLCVCAGLLGLWIGDLLEPSLIDQQKLAFPIGQLVAKMVSSQQQLQKSRNLFVGLGGGFIYGVLQDGLYFFKGIFPKLLVLIGKFRFWLFNIPNIDIYMPMLPMLWAIGFITGASIVTPLAVGAISKILILDPINMGLFAYITPSDFLLAFCSGMVVSGAVAGFISTPKTLWKTFRNFFKNNNEKASSMFLFSKSHLIEGAVILSFIFAFLTYFKFPILSQIYLILFSFVCAYQIAVIAGQIGLAQLGRFATYVMVPAMFIFKLNFVQLVIISTFVEIVGGVAADILFSRKMASMTDVESRKIKKYQILGLVVSAFAIGIIFWLLTSYLQLGSADLFAQRSQARQLLIDMKSFDYYVLLLGFLFGYLLKKIKVSPMLVLGGLLMPVYISLGLVLGGVSTFLFKDRDNVEPFASGIFAANSLWVIGRAALTLFK